jgi:hypothetical protein
MIFSFPVEWFRHAIGNGKLYHLLRWLLHPIFLVLLFFHTIGDLNAQDHASVINEIQAALAAHGFENVIVVQDGRDIIATYENRVYRYEVKALREALKLAVKYSQLHNDIVIIPQNRGIPIMAVKVDSNACRLLPSHEGGGFHASGFEATLGVEPYWHRLKDAQKTNASAMKLDIFVHPQFIAQFGNLRDAMQSQVNLAPAASTTLWRGMSLSAQWIFPIQNELGYEGDHGRPGFVTLNQTVRLPANTFVSGTAGYFSEHRFGCDLEVKRFWNNGRWAAGVNCGVTGFAAYSKGVWYYSDVASWTYSVTSQYRFPEFDLTLKAGYGRFLYQDDGWRIDVFRQFDEVEFGFFALSTEGGKNGGFSLSIPIFPSKRMVPGRVRLSPAFYFPWSYRYRGMPVYGIRYETQNDIDDFMKNLNPDFVENQL